MRDPKGKFAKGHITLGSTHPRYRHGMGSTTKRNPIYVKWSEMKKRCYNKNNISYKDYGAKGVTVSEDWMKFENFHRDMAPTYFPKASLDRIDNNKGYSKENCRWATMAEQARNKRTITFYEFGGERLLGHEWDKRLGLKEGTVRARIKRYGWSIERAVTERPRRSER